MRNRGMRAAIHVMFPLINAMLHVHSMSLCSYHRLCLATLDCSQRGIQTAGFPCLIGSRAD
jgi:hypothetical protein